MRWATFVTAGLLLAGGIAYAEAASQAPKKYSGIAAFYDTNYRGRTASGERYDPNKFTAAHKTLPFGTHVRVTDRKSGRSVVVVVNDRGPFNKGRAIDLSLAAAKALRMTGRGLIPVSFVVESPASVKTAAKPQAH
jgi:rare lipoprotein A